MSDRSLTENQLTNSILLAAKERKERIEIQGSFFAFLAFFRGQTALGVAFSVVVLAVPGQFHRLKPWPRRPTLHGETAFLHPTL